MPFRSAPRLKGFDYTGHHLYSLTICTRARARVFVTSDAVLPVVSQLLHVACVERFSVVAYCVMPDHLHILTGGNSPTSNLARFVRTFKQRTSFEWKQRTGDTLWQRSYFDRVLRSEEDVIGVVRYLLENPVRAGLVQRPEDYAYLGSATATVNDLLDAAQIRVRRT